jgi:hypothetical protein
MNYKDEIKKRIEELSAVCIIGEMLLWPEDRNRYLTYCENSVQSIFERNEILNNYKLFLFVIQEIENPNSKVERYKKIWKTIPKSVEIKKFKLGPELEIDQIDKMYFASIAEIDKEDFIRAMEIMQRRLGGCIIFASTKDNMLDSDSISNLFEIGFDAKENEINYLDLALNFCKDGDVIFRWGDSSEEAELDLIFDKKFIEYFQ